MALPLLIGCAAPHPVERVIDEELGVVCYVSDTGTACLEIELEDAEPNQRAMVDGTRDWI